MRSTIGVAVLPGRRCWRGCRWPAPRAAAARWRRASATPPSSSRRSPSRRGRPRRGRALTLGVEEVAGGLEHPWGMALLPDGALIVTERPGRMRIVAADGAVSEPLAGVPAVHARGQGGLLDVAVGPDFDEDRMVYWTYSKPLGDGLSATAAARGRLSEDRTAIEGATDIFVQTPPSPTAKHYGSRVLFDDDGALYVTTGEHSRAEERVLAQDLVGELRQGDAAAARRVGAARQPVRRRARRDRGHLELRPSQRAGRGDPSRVGGALDRRARAEGRRRAEPPGTGAELRLAGGQLRPQLRRLAGRLGGGLGARLRGAGLLLGPGDRAGRHGLLHRRRCSRTGRATC